MCKRPRPNCVNIVRFGAPYPSRFCSPPKHITMGEKASTHWREVIPYKHILMCFPRRCGIPWNARPPFLGHYNPPPLRAHASSRVGPTLLSRAWLWYHLLWPRPNCVNIVRFGASYPLQFCSPPKHTAIGEKASTHWREVIPYKHIPMCFPRWCGIPWNARPPFLGHYNPPPLRAHASSCVGPTLLARAWLWYHL